MGLHPYSKRNFMKIFITAVLLLIGISSVIAIPLPIGGFNEPVTAFACKSCSFAAAKNIAIQNAPENNCSIYQGRGNPAFCESITKTIFVPVLSTEDVFKFTVITSIGSDNRPEISVYSDLPTTAIESALMAKYFALYKDFQASVNSANISTADLPPLPEFTLGNKPFYSSSSNDDCSGHPIQYFKGKNEKTSIRTDLAAQIKVSMSGSTVAEFENEPLTNGTSIDVQITGAGASVSSQYIKNNLVLTRGDSFDNRLVFIVSLYTDPTKGNQTAFGLALHRGFTKIDGFRYSEIFGGDNVDMSDIQMSSCLREFLQGGDEVDQSKLPGGGEGSYKVPFEGRDILNGGERDWCRVITTIPTCIEQTDGGQICSETTYNWTEICSSLHKNRL
jgi:hypothetical protein